jgi:hypothetical protein
MAKVRNVVGKMLAAGAVCSLSLAGCTGAASPIAPTAPSNSPSVALVPAARTEAPIQPVAGLRKKPDDRFLICLPADGSFHQFSLEAMGGMNEAMQYCHKVLDGKSGGIVTAPPPEAP